MIITKEIESKINKIYQAGVFKKDLETAIKKDRLSEQELDILIENIEIVSLFKPIFNATKHRQGENTKKNNQKNREIVSQLEAENNNLKNRLSRIIDESEIVNAGKWLLNALSVDRKIFLESESMGVSADTIIF